MKINMISKELEREMKNYIVIIASKNSDQTTIVKGEDAIVQLESDIINFMKDKEPGKWIVVPEEYISDHINALNFDYKIMKKYKVNRKEQKNSIVYRMEGHNFYATREKLMKEGYVLIDSYYNDDNGRVSGCLLEKNDNIVGISIPGMVPHPSMDDIILAFDQKLFHEIGRLFPHLWMAHSYDDPMNIKAFFRYSDLYNVE